MLSKNELMRQRYKCIADFWDNPFKVGSIIEMVVMRKHPFSMEDDNEYWYSALLTIEGITGKTAFCETQFSDYPNLFTKIPWYANRKVEEMPQYCEYVHGARFPKGTILKAEQWEYHETTDFWFKISSYQFYNNFVGDFIPATLEDYNNYLKTLKP